MGNTMASLISRLDFSRPAIESQVTSGFMVNISRVIIDANSLSSLFSKWGKGLRSFCSITFSTGGAVTEISAAGAAEDLSFPVFDPTASIDIDSSPSNAIFAEGIGGKAEDLRSFFCEAELVNFRLASNEEGSRAYRLDLLSLAIL